MLSMRQNSNPLSLKYSKTNLCSPKLIQASQLYTLISIPMISPKDLSPECGFQPCPIQIFFHISPISSYLQICPLKLLVSTLDKCQSLYDPVALKLFAFSIDYLFIKTSVVFQALKLQLEPHEISSSFLWRGSVV